MPTQMLLFPNLPPPSPTVTNAQLLAARVSEAIDAIAEMIPILEGPHRLTEPGTRGARTVSRAFLERMISSVDEEHDLQVMESFDVSDARAMLQFNDAFRPVARRAAWLARCINFTMSAWRARVVRRAMATYAAMKGLARDADSGHLEQRAKSLRAALGRKNAATALRHP